MSAIVMLGIVWLCGWMVKEIAVEIVHGKRTAGK